MSRSREEILSELYFKKQFQGNLSEKAIVEILLDQRQLLIDIKEKLCGAK